MGEVALNAGKHGSRGGGGAQERAPGRGPGPSGPCVLLHPASRALRPGRSALPAWSSETDAGPRLCVRVQVRKSGSRVMFLLVDKETDEHHAAQHVKFERDTARLEFLPLQPRAVEMEKGSSGYGFHLRSSPEQKGKARGEPEPAVSPLGLTPGLHEAPSSSPGASGGQ